MQTAVFTLKRIWKTSSLNAREADTDNGLNTPQSVSAVFLTVLDVYFVVFSDSKNYASFLVEEISLLGHTIKSLYSRRLKKFEPITFSPK